jgi:hypothetical protein
MTRHIVRAEVFKWTVLVTGALLTMRLFFVQQLLAALLLFSILFAGLAVVALVLFGLDLAWQTALGGAESFVMALGRWRRGPVSINHSTAVNMLAPVLVPRATSHK